MLCYKDKTFCPFWEQCEDGKDCNRALIETVKEEAKIFFDRMNMPILIAQYTEPPEHCFKDIIKWN
jgi:hypothetical protein